MPKQLFEITITREVTYTIFDIVANTPEEAESEAELQDASDFSEDFEYGEILNIQAVPSETIL